MMLGIVMLGRTEFTLKVRSMADDLHYGHNGVGIEQANILDEAVARRCRNVSRDIGRRFMVTHQPRQVLDYVELAKERSSYCGTLSSAIKPGLPRDSDVRE